MRKIFFRISYDINKDYYKIMGVNKNITQNDLKLKYY